MKWQKAAMAKKNPRSAQENKATLMFVVIDKMLYRFHCSVWVTVTKSIT